MPNTFNDLLRASARALADKSLSAEDWFSDSVEDLKANKTKADPNKYFKKQSLPQIGGMYLYLYDPKYKATLPFYDMYPLTMPVEMYLDGFLGINLHYLPALARIRLLNSLIDFTDENKYKMNKRLSLSYEILRGYSTLFKGVDGCIKKYLFSHVRSSFHEVDPSNWEKAAVLPLQRWKVNSNKRYAGSPPY